MAKKKFRINILDFLILAVVILCIAGALLRGGVKTTDEKLETQTAVISFAIFNVQGRIVGEIEATPSVYYVEKDGEIVRAYSDIGRVDLRGTFECEGQMSESGFLIGGTQYIAPGMTTYAYLPNINANIMIMDVTLK